MVNTKTTPAKQERKCPLCPWKTANDDELKDHIFRCAMNRFQCHLCDFSTKRKAYLHKHIRNRHEPATDVVQVPQSQDCSDPAASPPDSAESWNHDPDVSVDLAVSSSESDHDNTEVSSYSPAHREAVVALPSSQRDAPSPAATPLPVQKATTSVDYVPLGPCIRKPTHPTLFVPSRKFSTIDCRQSFPGLPASSATCSRSATTETTSSTPVVVAPVTAPAVDPPLVCGPQFIDAAVQTTAVKFRKRVRKTSSYIENGRKIRVVETQKYSDFE